MIKRIIGTFISRSAGMVLSFLVLMLTTRYLGAEGRGEVSLWLARVVLMSLVASFAGGPALVYHASRKPVLSLLFPAYVMATIITMITTLILFFIYPYENSSLWLAAMVSLFITFTGFHQNILIGHNAIKHNNEIIVLQVLLLCVGCLVLFNTTDQPTPVLYMLASLVTNVLVYIWSCIRIYRYVSGSATGQFSEYVKLIMKQGLVSQWSNVLQFLNYRYTFFVLAFMWNDALVGIYSVAVALCESLWLAGKSIALVQLGEVATGKNETLLIQNTWKMTLYSFGITLGGLIALFIIPATWYQAVFGARFTGVSEYMPWLGPGVLALSLQFSISHYFAGKGIFRYNNYAAGIGLVGTVILSAWLVKDHAGKGAAITTSVAYIISTAFLWICFLKYIRRHHEA